MRLVVLFLIEVASIIGPTALTASPSNATLLVELRRGFNVAAYATADSGHTEAWIQNFERAVAVGQQNGTNSDAFLLGARFGLSYRIAAFERQDQNPFGFDVQRTLAVRGTLARLQYEQEKRRLGVTDADLLQILHIPVSSFSAWKSSVVTSDDDTTVVDPRGWLLL